MPNFMKFGKISPRNINLLIILDIMRAYAEVVSGIRSQN